LLNPNESLIELLAAATSSKIALTLTLTLLCFTKELTVSTVFSNISSVSLPCNLAKVAMAPACSSANPSLVVNTVKVSKVSPPKSAINPDLIFVLLLVSYLNLMQFG